MLVASGEPRPGQGCGCDRGISPPGIKHHPAAATAAAAIAFWMAAVSRVLPSPAVGTQNVTGTLNPSPRTAERQRE